jgi:hypothetical protein
MFGGSDEYVLREILDNVDHIKDLHKVITECYVELQYANCLKEYELGIIDKNEFNYNKQQVENLRERLYNNNR